MYKSINTYKFNNTTKRWNFAESSFDELETKVINLGFDLVLSSEPLKAPKVQPLKAKIKRNNNENTIEIEMAYNKDMVEFFKTILSRKFDGITKLWSFHLNELNNIQNKLIENDIGVEHLSTNDNFQFKKTSYFCKLKD